MISKQERDPNYVGTPSNCPSSASASLAPLHPTRNWRILQSYRQCDTWRLLYLTAKGKRLLLYEKHWTTSLPTIRRLLQHFWDAGKRYIAFFISSHFSPAATNPSIACLAMKHPLDTGIVGWPRMEKLCFLDNQEASYFFNLIIL